MSNAKCHKYTEHDKPWFQERQLILDDRVRARLRQLSARLGNADWLDGEFSAGDLLMVQVLRRLHGSGLLEEFPNLAAYVARGEARPAFKRAFAAQLAVFTGTRTVDKAPLGIVSEVSTMGTTRPTTRPAHAFSHFIEADADAAAPGFIFLGGCNPADPFVACQGRDVRPYMLRNRVRFDRPAKIRRQSVWQPGRDLIFTHVTRPNFIFGIWQTSMAANPLFMDAVLSGGAEFCCGRTVTSNRTRIWPPINRSWPRNGFQNRPARWGAWGPRPAFNRDGRRMAREIVRPDWRLRFRGQLTNAVPERLRTSRPEPHACCSAGRVSQ